MSGDDNYINPIERSLLADLIGLYACDLRREPHRDNHIDCIACSKQEIIRAIERYRELDSMARKLETLVAPATALVDSNPLS
jgi:hypothetical protein